MDRVREKCVFCKCQLEEEFQLPKMPVFMGTTPINANYLYSPMTFMKCSNCGTIQIKELIEPAVLYQSNHNTEVVGKIWKQHFEQFSAFIQKGVEGKNVLEISDPMAKIARICQGYQQWTIVEPNSSLESTEQIKFINEFFSPQFVPKLQPNVIIHSHFLEHTFDPAEFLQTCYRLLPTDGTMCFSVPHMKHGMEQEYTPNCVLNFEHTFYFEHERIQEVLSNYGFVIIDHQLFLNHSLFYKVQKTSISNIPYTKLKTVFDFESHLAKIRWLNRNVQGVCFLYGAHVPSQFYLFNGLTIPIQGILDQSNKKVGNYLYGTDLRVFAPEHISNLGQVTVICKHMGEYTTEIMEQLYVLNGEVICV